MSEIGAANFLKPYILDHHCYSSLTFALNNTHNKPRRKDLQVLMDINFWETHLPRKKPAHNLEESDSEAQTSKSGTQNVNQFLQSHPQ